MRGSSPSRPAGDHSITLPIFRAIARHRPVGMVHFDAHCDTHDDYLGSKFHHGAPFRRAVEEGLLDPHRTIQIGIRGGVSDVDVWKFSHDSGMRVVYMEELFERGWRSVIKEARAVAGDGPTYVSFDVDGLDPVYAPGTGTPEVGGFSTIEAQLMIRALSGLDLVGGRRGGGRAALRPQRQHRAGGRDDDVRDPVRGGAGSFRRGGRGKTRTELMHRSNLHHQIRPVRPHGADTENDPRRLPGSGRAWPDLGYGPGACPSATWIRPDVIGQADAGAECDASLASSISRRSWPQKGSPPRM